MEEILSLKSPKAVERDEARCARQMQTRIAGNYFIRSEETVSALKLEVNLCRNICRQLEED